MKKNSKQLLGICGLLDIFIVFISYYASEWLYLEIIARSHNIVLREEYRNIIFFGVFAYAIVLYLCFICCGVYRSQRFNGLWHAWLTMAIVNVVLLTMVMALLYYYRVEDFSRGLLLTFWIVSCILLLIRHLSCFLVLRMIRRSGFNQRHVILVGSGEIAEEYISEIENNPRYGITVDGYVSPIERFFSQHACIYLGGYDQLNKYTAGTGVDEVVIALDVGEMPEIQSIIQCCERNGVKVSVIPFFNRMISNKPEIKKIGKLKCFSLRSSPLDLLNNRVIKRAFDIVLSLFVIILLSPLMIFVSIMIKLTSRGPVIFKQKRIGKDKKPFTMLKFRSMRVNSGSSTFWSRNTDDRKTWFGSLIRKTSIDELPQFFNVLRGDMSVVGPRPEIPVFVEEFKKNIPNYMLKHLVKPGITGWAQVNGFRGDTSIKERIIHDIWYIENWSFGLDLKITFRTVFGGMINKEKLQAIRPAHDQPTKKK